MNSDDGKPRRGRKTANGKAVERKAAAPQAVVSIKGDAAVISRRAADRLHAGHVWVYRSDVVSVPAVEGDGAAPHLLAVVDQRGALLGTALYSPVSEIALRLVSSELLDQAAWLDLLAMRLR